MFTRLHNLLSSPKFHSVYPLALVVILLGGLFVTLGLAQQQQDNRSKAAGACTATQEQVEANELEIKMLDLINNYRQTNNVPTLGWSDELTVAAVWLGADMQISKNLSHQDSLGRTPEIRLTDCNIPVFNGYAENIASGPLNADVVFDAWKNSPSHNATMLDAKLKFIGIAMVPNAENTQAYWVTDFSADAPAETTTAPTTNPSAAPTQTTTQTPTQATTPAPTQPGGATQTPPTTSPTSGQPTVEPTKKNSKEPTATPPNVALDMQVSVKVAFNGVGRTGNSSPKHLSRKVTVLVYGANDEPVTTGTGFVSYDGQEYFTGVIRLGKLSEGAYFIKVVGDFTLQSLIEPEFQMLLDGRVNELPPVMLRQGDLTGDNVLNIEDFNIALKCYQIARCEGGRTIDFNDDGNADVQDYNILLNTFKEFQGR